MDATHFHLAFTHGPIVGVIMCTLLIAAGFILKSVKIKQVAYVFLVLIGILTIPVYLTGEAAEETVERLGEVSHKVIHEHEEAAEAVIWLMLALSLSALFSLVAATRKMAIAKMISYVTVVLSIMACFAFIRVGSLGGKIRHTEINSSTHLDEHEENEHNMEHEDDEHED